ncbi:hypothetical protein ABVK25_012283 [Lepraria finkii]|uniref:Uncharacterized protein n=1 Tax=Lepraria finkii TaxID=1340010 RepID=A0ABR4AGL6_9LECA
MGSCLSCLGLTQQSHPKTLRASRHQDSFHQGPYRSYNDPDGPYRSQGQMQAPHSPDQGTETSRQDSEAFEAICHTMSDEVVDIFTSPLEGEYEENESDSRLDHLNKEIQNESFERPVAKEPETRSRSPEPVVPKRDGVPQKSIRNSVDRCRKCLIQDDGSQWTVTGYRRPNDYEINGNTLDASNRCKDSGSVLPSSRRRRKVLLHTSTKSTLDKVSLFSETTAHTYPSRRSQWVSVQMDSARPLNLPSPCMPFVKKGQKLSSWHTNGEFRGEDDVSNYVQNQPIQKAFMPHTNFSYLTILRSQCSPSTPPPPSIQNAIAPSNKPLNCSPPLLPLLAPTSTPSSAATVPSTNPSTSLPNP